MAAIDGESSLKTLVQTSPPSYLTPSPHLSRHARIACRHLYSSLISSCPNPKPPLDDLLIDDTFDAEQIWCQIDLFYRPLISLLKKEARKVERDPPDIGGLKKKKAELVEEDTEDADTDEAEEGGEEEEEEEEDGGDEGESEDEEEKKDVEEVKIDGNGNNEIEDEFLKVNELEKFLVKDEEREFGNIDDVSDKKDNEDDDDNDGNPLDLLYGDLDDGSDEEQDENARYEDFWGDNRKKGGEKRNNIRKEKSFSKNIESSDEPEEDSDNEPEEDSDDEPMKHSSDSESDDNSDADVQENKTLSTHEKEQLKIRAEIEKREKANLDPKAWTMQGEVTAAKRPKNSALEVDLDFEHNMKPPPVITEEFTASIEDLIKQRIIEGKFDDVQKAPALPSKAPKELKELDENKSKKGLAELYEEEYAQQTGLAAAPLSSLDVDKNEATMLFKKLCLKLDALSHFNFAPKPVIEEMSIQSNVPALAMEEIAPIAVSDAAMLAPEEIFKGKGDVKEEAELTKEERKRRRASKKRKFKARKAKSEATKKARQNASTTQLNDPGAEESRSLVNPVQKFWSSTHLFTL